MTTALDTITGSLRLLGVVGSGDVPSPEDTSIALSALNELLETWSTDNLVIFTPVDQTFTLTPGTADYTLGPTGLWVGFRPTQIDQLRIVYQSIVFEVTQWDNLRFNAIPFPTQPGPLPFHFAYQATMPNGTVSLWPVPNQAISVSVTSNQQLTQIASLSTTLVFPPGYKRAMRFNLAKDLQSEFGAPLSPLALETAAKSLGAIKRANMSPVEAVWDPMYSGNGYGGTGFTANPIVSVDDGDVDGGSP